MANQVNFISGEGVSLEGDAGSGAVTISLSAAAIASLAKADSAVQEEDLPEILDNLETIAYDPII